MKKVVLAYSGGLDTSVAVAWLREKYDCEVVTLTVDVGGGSLREGVERRAMQRGRVAGLRRRCAGAVRPRLRLAAPPGERAVPGRLPARDRAGPAADRPAPRRGRPARGRRRGRPRLHRQGQRPGPLRRRRPRPRSGAGGGRPDAGRDGPDPRPGDRLRRRARHRDPDHQGLALLDRRQPLGPVVRDRHPRGSRGSRRRPTRTSGRSTGRRRPAPVEIVIEFEGGIPVAIDGERLDAGRARRAASRARRRARRRPDRSRRGPPRRDQEPRDLRGAGGDDPPRGAPRARGADAHQGHAAVQPPRRRRAGPADLRRAVVLAPCTATSAGTWRRRSAS